MTFPIDPIRRTPASKRSTHSPSSIRLSDSRKNSATNPRTLPSGKSGAGYAGV